MKFMNMSSREVRQIEIFDMTSGAAVEVTEAIYLSDSRVKLDYDAVNGAYTRHDGKDFDFDYIYDMANDFKNCLGDWFYDSWSPDDIEIWIY